MNIFEAALVVSAIAAGLVLIMIATGLVGVLVLASICQRGDRGAGEQ